MDDVSCKGQAVSEEGPSPRCRGTYRLGSLLIASGCVAEEATPTPCCPSDSLGRMGQLLSIDTA